ncbi:hypothetical protein RB598_005242 [Gaeumannomyces tritici]
MTAKMTLQRACTFRDDEDDYDGDDAPVQPLNRQDKDQTLSTFNEIIDGILAKKLSLKTRNDREAFTESYKGELQNRTREKSQTILHRVAGTLGHKTLTRMLIEKFPHLLEAVDRDNSTPLYLAIAESNVVFINVVLERARNVDGLLSTMRDSKGNCIHAAIRHDLAHQNLEVMLQLIDKASETTLCAKDRDNNCTPLHLAVEYARCKPPQLDVVRKLIAKGGKALDEVTMPDGLSVYQYHVHTRSRTLEKVRIRERERERDGASNGRQESSTERDSSGGQDSRAGGELTMMNQDLDGQGAWQRRGWEEGVGSTVACDDEHAHTIGEEIKLRYLRTTITAGNDRLWSPIAGTKARNQRTATRFLHGANPECISLCFDYSQCPQTISMAAFEESYRHIKLDGMLRYVAFGVVELEKAPPLKNPRLAGRLPARPKAGRGRSDLTFFFDWLSEKEVKSILKVSVDELHDKPHCDEAIEKCLKRFNVEILDWRRQDLCPETIYNACRDVRELYLRWSGNRAVLRAWSEPEGLPRLPSLKRVCLIWNTEQALESDTRTESHLNGFRDRMKKSLKSLPGGTGSEAREILIDDIRDNIPNSERLAHVCDQGKPLYISERGMQGHRWLDCMDKFTDEMQNIKVPEKRTARIDDITIALIDDGVNLEADSLRGKVMGGDTFDSGFPYENGPSPYHVSRKGHGTVMADMICRIFPLAKLYILKLEAHESPDPTDNHRDLISAQSAALAVDAAVEKGVDIISMSWTVKATSENKEGIAQLRQAVIRALDRGMLLFCAAGDTGAISEVEYPHSIDPNRIFRIGAAMADGRVWPPTGQQQSLDFILPGHNVVTRNPRGSSTTPGGFEENTGSSVATAVAAGLAGLILHCVRLGAIYAECEANSDRTVVQVSDFACLKAYDKMRSVLRAIGLDESQKFIEVWHRFEAPAAALKAAAPPARMEVVAELARNLISCIRKF